MKYLHDLNFFYRNQDRACQISTVHEKAMPAPWKILDQILFVFRANCGNRKGYHAHIAQFQMCPQSLLIFFSCHLLAVQQ